MYCKNCGTQIDDNAVVCPNCMYRNEPINPGYGYNNQNYASNNAETPIAQYSWNKSIVSSIFIFFALLGFDLLVIAVLTKGKWDNFFLLILLGVLIIIAVVDYIFTLKANYGLYFKLYNDRLETKCRCSHTKEKTVCTFLLNEIQAVSVNNKVVVITAKNEYYNFVTKNKQQSNLVKSKIEQSRNSQQEYTVFD